MAKKSIWSRINPFSKPKRKYEAASRSPRNQFWHTTSGSANAEISDSLQMVRDRSRDLVRNNPFAARAMQSISTNTVGKGIQTQLRGVDQKKVDQANAEWKVWTQSKLFDFDGRYDIFGFQRMEMRAVPESGEVLIRRVINRKLDFPVQYQILESDFLDTGKESNLNNGNSIVDGVEVTKSGQIVAYWVFESHPGDTNSISFLAPTDSKRIPADQIFSIFKQDRPGQLRGMPWLAPVMIRLRDLDEYENAQIVRQKIAACFTAFVHDISADVGSYDAEGPPPYYADEQLGEKVQPGQIEFLPTGKDVKFSSPPEVTNYDQFTKNVLRSIAAGLGISYEVLTGDLSQVNFSSARLGWIEFQRNLEVWRKEIVIAQFLDRVVQDFKDFSALRGRDYSDLFAVHTPPRREMIDPSKEISASKDAIRAGLSSWTEELQAYGKDPEEHFNQLAKDKALIDRLGLKLDSDPSFNSTISSAPITPVDTQQDTQQGQDISGTED